MNSNDITMSGIVNRITRKTLPAGRAVLEIEFAGVRQKDAHQIPHYAKAVMYGQTASRLGQIINEQDHVLVKGSINHRRWDGGNAYEILASQILMRDGTIETTTDSKGNVRVMNAVNSATLAGNLTKDIIHRKTQNSEVAYGTIAINPPVSFKGTPEQRAAAVNYIPFEVWGEQARDIASLKKGQAVDLVGAMESTSFQGENSMVYRTYIATESIYATSERSMASVQQAEANEPKELSATPTPEAGQTTYTPGNPPF